MASKFIIALRDTVRCPFCLRTAHTTAFPVRPMQYALINLHERFMKQRITSAQMPWKPLSWLARNDFLVLAYSGTCTTPNNTIISIRYLKCQHPYLKAFLTHIIINLVVHKPCNAIGILLFLSFPWSQHGLMSWLIRVMTSVWHVIGSRSVLSPELGLHSDGECSV